jgi:glycosyltransferase involved in cell wall biosynthesis
MDLSVVINCSDDLRVISTINSIDEKVEIICSITPNAQIEKLLAERKILYVITPKGNQSHTTNVGINLAKHDKIILMDSDSRFAPGVIKKINRLLNDYSVVNGRIVFEDDGTFLSRKIAACRKYDNAYGSPSYKPGLGLRKELVDTVGSWFNPLVRWTDDAELSYRIKSAGVPVFHLDEDCVYHSPISFWGNIKSSFRYGKGDLIRVKVLGQTSSEPFFDYEIRRYKNLLESVPLSTFLFMLLNDAIYHLGYLTELFTRAFKVRRKSIE